MAAAFPNQKMTHGGAIFGGVVRIMSQPEPDFDPDQLVTVLQTRRPMNGDYSPLDYTVAIDGWKRSTMPS